MPKVYDDHQYQNAEMSSSDREQDLNGVKDESGISAMPKYHTIIPWIFLLALTAAELAVGYWSISVGMVMHIILLIAMLTMAVLSWYHWERGQAVYSSASREVGFPLQPQEEAPEAGLEAEEAQAKGCQSIHKWALHSYRFYIGLCIAPLIRILSLAIPFQGVPTQYIYLVTGVPLLATIIAVAKMAGFSMSDLYLSWKNRQGHGSSWEVQLAIALIGIPLGFMEYFILHPKPIIPELAPSAVLTASLILIIFTGLTEELTFRGIMKRTGDDLIGWKINMIYASLVFAVLHITHLSVLDVFFAFGVGLLFSSIVYRTESLYGVTLAHGLTNINLFIFAPLLLG